MQDWESEDQNSHAKSSIEACVVYRITEEA